MYHSDCPSLTFHHRHRHIHIHIRPSFSLPSSHSMEQMDRMRRLTSPGVRAQAYHQKNGGCIQHIRTCTQTSIHIEKDTTNCGKNNNMATSQLRSQSQSQSRTTSPLPHPPNPHDLTHSDIIYTDHDDDDEMRSSSTASVISSTSELSLSSTSTSVHDDDLHHISPPPLPLSPRSSFDAHVIPNFESLIGESIEKHYFHGTMKKRCYQIGTDSSWYEMDTPLISPSPSSLVHPHHDVTLTDAYALLLRLSTLTDTHTVTPAHPSHLSGHYLIDWLVEHCSTSPWFLTSRHHAHDVCQAMMYMGWIQSVQTCHRDDESIHIFHDTNVLYRIVIPSYVILNDIIKTTSNGTIVHVPIPTPIAPRPKRASSCTLPRGSSLTITRSPSESPTPHDTPSGQAITLSISCITTAISCWTLHNFTSLESLIIQLRTVVLDEMDMYESITFWLNIYHTLMLHALHISTLPTTTIQRIIMYQTYQYVIAGDVYSLLDIEYGILRACMTQETMRPRDRFIPYPPRFSSTDRRHRHTHHMWKDPRITFLMCDGSSEGGALHIITPVTLPKLIITATQRYLIQHIHLQNDTRISHPSTYACPSQLHVSIPPLFAHHRSSFNATSGSLIRWLITHHPAWDVTSKIADFAASHACHLEIRPYHSHVNMEHAFRTCDGSGDVTPNTEED